MATTNKDGTKFEHQLIEFKGREALASDLAYWGGQGFRLVAITPPPASAGPQSGALYVLMERELPAV